MPTNTRPNLPRSFSSGYDADGEYEPIHDLRHTQSLPASFPSTQPWRPRTRALSGPGLGLRVGLPSTPTIVTRKQLRTERATAPALGDVTHSEDTIHGGLPMRRSGWGAGMLSEPNQDVASRHMTSTELVIPRERMMRNPLRPIVPSTPAGAQGLLAGNDRNSSVEPGNRLFRPLGDSMSVPSPTSPPSPGADMPRSFTINGGSITPPGAPLLPSASHLGVHRHFPGLDHRTGGPADEDALMTRPLLTPARGRSHIGFRPVSSQRLPIMSRFATYAPYR